MKNQCYRWRLLFILFPLFCMQSPSVFAQQFDAVELREIAAEVNRLDDILMEAQKFALERINERAEQVRSSAANIVERQERAGTSIEEFKKSLNEATASRDESRDQLISACR